MCGGSPFLEMTYLPNTRNSHPAEGLDSRPRPFAHSESFGSLWGEEGMAGPSQPSFLTTITPSFDPSYPVIIFLVFSQNGLYTSGNQGTTQSDGRSRTWNTETTIFPIKPNKPGKPGRPGAFEEGLGPHCSLFFILCAENPPHISKTPRLYLF